MGGISMGVHNPCTRLESSRLDSTRASCLPACLPEPMLALALPPHLTSPGQSVSVSLVEEMGVPVAANHHLD